MQTDNFKGSEKFELPKEFQAAGISAGIKPSAQKDMTLLYSSLPAAMAGTFTRNRCAAAPVQLCRRHLKSGAGRAIVVNSGVANAGTGEQGRRDAEETAETTAAALGIASEEVFVCSTGSVGKYLPMQTLKGGIEKLAAAKSGSRQGSKSAAEAIMTTDTRPKSWTVATVIDGREVTVSGIAKGAGMIEPDMATMLAFILTDADCDQAALQSCLAEAVARTFNRITVDGDMSTNDTVLLMANGAAGNAPLSERHPDWDRFKTAVYEVASRLAWMILQDGEGATKLATIRVGNAFNDEDAEKAARAIANSLLVKTAWAGVKPGYGRIMDALGYSGASLEPEKIDILYNGLPAIKAGVRGDATEEQLSECVGLPEFTVAIDLQQGAGKATVYTCNITEEYVRINFV